MTSKTFLLSQKSFCNMLAVAARPDCLAGGVGRGSPEAHSSFREEMGEVRGAARGPGRPGWCPGRNHSFRDRLGKVRVSPESFGDFLKFGMG